MKSRTLVAAAVGVTTVLTLGACSGTGSGGGGEATPSGDIRMIVPFSAGGGSDQSGRAIAAGLEEGTGLNISVENREGGSGAVGYSYFLGQDGNPNHLLASETALLALPLTQDVEFSYESFTPIMKLGDDFTLMVVPADSKWSTCAEVVESARTERVIAAVSGATSLDEIVFTLVENDQDVEFDRVPFESGGEVLAGLLGGQVDVASLNPSEVLGQLESGDLKALCAFSEDRYEYEALADVPTATEQGVDVSFAQFRGFIAPGGISEEARAYWIDAAEAFAESPAYDAYIDENVMQANVLYGDEFVDYLEGNNADLEQVFAE